jgi:UDP-N-acetylglucosamine/UDP-N-acetylgalactosamine diphosphorylase
MAGGTSPSDHSEVGSSFIHFNYTPNQDKATPSLIGDVPRGVMLDQHPIFLGGQGGVVGPCRVEYGTVTAAGATLRHDILTADQIVLDGLHRAVKLKSTPGKYTNIQRLLSNNLRYIANLAALAQWYRHVRVLFVGKSFPLELLAGLRASLKSQIEERIHRLGQLAHKMELSHRLSPPESQEQRRQKQFHQRWSQIEERLAARMEAAGSAEAAERFLHRLTGDGRFSAASYLEAIRGAAPETKTTGQWWLQHIVDTMMDDVQQILPAFRIQ